MKTRRLTDQEWRQLFELANDGAPVVMLCRTYGVSDTTYYRWRQRLVEANASSPWMPAPNSATPRLPGC